MSPSTISCSPAGLTETGLLSRARRDPRTLSGYTADLPFKPASALISVEALEVLGCFIGIYPKAVMRERVNERRDEYCPLARGPDEESRVRETARFVEVSKAGIVCPARCRPAFADYRWSSNRHTRAFRWSSHCATPARSPECRGSGKAR